MSHKFELSDEQYQIIAGVATAEGRTPEELFLAWAMDEEMRYRQAHPTYYETDEWLRHLGMTDHEIHEIDAEIEAEAQANGNADS